MIRLGYELRTGRAVDIPLDHTAVTGRTQQSGKTTTLEALVHRSGLRAVVFVTKKAESGFRSAHAIPPFFIESADWEFVSAVLESTIHQNLKFERSWIMDACKGAKSLGQVQENVRIALHGVRNPNYGQKKKGHKRDDREWQKKPATGMNYSILNVLDGYLQKVVPQIQALPYTKTLELGSGLNVMDLHQYSTELQALVIRSVLEWVYQHEKNTVVIIPEAWEFIPQNRRSPVLLAAEELIRKGAASKNFVWLDAQDIASMHKNVLRSVGVWILGVQREANEIKRMLNHIPAPRPSATDVMQLERGQFFACYSNVMRKTYVQPFWVGDEHARAIAMGEEPTTSVEKIWSESERELVAQTPEKKHPAAEPSQGRKYEIQKNFANTEPSTSDVICALPSLRTFHENFEALAHSRTEIPIQSVDPFPGPTEDQLTDRSETVWKEKFEESQREIESLKAYVNQLTDIIARAGLGKQLVDGSLKFETPTPQHQDTQTYTENFGTPRSLGEPPSVHLTDFNNGTYELLKARLLIQSPQLLLLLEQTPVETKVPAHGAARSGDPDTSWAAARGMNPKGLATHIVSLLRRHAAGLTIDELTDMTGKEKVSVSPRLAQLARRGLVRDSGRRKLNGKKHEVIIWEAIL
jgi:hypothetical protein